MRVRIQSLPPLPAFKAWISTESIQTIADLKSILLHSVNVDSSEKLRLELDAFELLDSSPVADILRDNDLIVYVLSFTHLLCLMYTVSNLACNLQGLQKSAR